MKLIETGPLAEMVVRAQKRVLIRGARLAWGDRDDHPDPAGHPFNNYSDEANESDRDVHQRNEHGYPDWAWQTFLDHHGHEIHDRGKDDKDK